MEREDQDILFTAHQHVEKIKDEEKRKKEEKEKEKAEKLAADFDEASMELAGEVFKHFTSLPLVDRTAIISEVEQLFLDDHNTRDRLNKNLSPNTLAVLVASVTAQLVEDLKTIDARFEPIIPRPLKRPLETFIPRPLKRHRHAFEFGKIFNEPEIVSQTVRGGGQSRNIRFQKKVKKALAGVDSIPRSLARMAAKIYKEHLGRTLSQGK